MSNHFSKLRIISEQLKVSTATPHSCPLTQLTYYADCTIYTCPLNIARDSPGRGGCYLAVGKPTILDAATALHKTTGEIKRRFRHGLQEVERFLQFYNWLQQQREFSKPIHNTCKHCGVITSTSGNCLNKPRCQRRQKLLRQAQQLPPLNLPELKVTAAEFWEIALAQSQEKFVCLLPAPLLQRAQNQLRRLPQYAERLSVNPVN